MWQGVFLEALPMVTYRYLVLLCFDGRWMCFVDCSSAFTETQLIPAHSGKVKYTKENLKLFSSYITIIDANFVLIIK